MVCRKHESLLRFVLKPDGPVFNSHVREDVKPNRISSGPRADTSLATNYYSAPVALGAWRNFCIHALTDMAI